MSLKKIIKKSVAAFVAITLLYSNSYLCGLGMLKVIAQDIKEPNLNLNIQNTQYVQFKEEVKEAQEENSETKEKEIEYYSGVAIKTKLEVGIEEQDTLLPIKRAELSISLPALNGYMPVRANVVAANTILSTGEKNINKINQNYDSNSGLLKVSYENSEAYSKYNKESKDEFEIIYIYQSEAYTGNEKEVLLQYAVNSKMTFEVENGKITSDKTQSFELKEKENKGELLEFNVTGLENNIYKGFMYSNVEHGTNYNTDYNTISTLCVLNSNIAKDLTMEMKENNFSLKGEENTKISTEGAVIYKATNITETEFDKILGKDGALEIYSNGTLIATIRYIDVNENDQLVKRLAIIYSDDNIKLLSEDESIVRVEYNSDVTSITIKTTKPISEGYINFKNECTIKASKEYSAKVEEIKSVETTSVVNENIKSVEILLLEPETKISVNSSNVNFSTLQTNKTTLTILLDSTDPSTKLLKNPTITIKLPDGLVGGNLSSPEIVNGNGLKIKNTSAKGSIITIELEGVQTEYDLTNVSGGTTLVMDIENIDFEDTIATHEDKIDVTCIQGKEETKVEQKINIVSKAGLLVLSKLTGYDDNKSTLKSIDNEIKVVKIANNAKQREAIQTIDLVNNYDVKIDITEIIGRIGYTNNELNSTFDISLSKPIEVSNAKVYYSTNKDAQYNDNSWSDKFITNAKSYKIEINNKELKSKDKLAVKLYYNIPANMEFNEKTFVKTEINYIYNEKYFSDSSTFGMETPVNTLKKNGAASKVMMTSQNGAKNAINVTVTPNITQNYVHSGQRVVYTIKVTNNGTEDLNNITVEDLIPDNAIYTYVKKVEGLVATYNEIVKDEQTKNVSSTIEILKAGKSLEFEIMLTMANVAEEQEIVNKVVLKYNDQSTITESKLTLKPAKIEANLITSEETVIGPTYNIGSETIYYINVKNVTDKTLKNVTVNFELPEELEYIEGGFGEEGVTAEYIIKDPGKINNNKFEYTINKLSEGEQKVICIKVRVKELSEGFEKFITTISKLNIEDDEDIYETNIKTIKTEQSKYTMKVTSNSNPDTVYKQGDEIIYTVEAESLGAISGYVRIKDNLPEQLVPVKVEEYVDGELKNMFEGLNQEVKWLLDVQKGKKVELKIYTIVDLVESETLDNIEVTNFITLSYANKEIKSEDIKIKIQPELVIKEDFEEWQEPEDEDKDEVVEDKEEVEPVDPEVEDFDDSKVEDLEHKEEFVEPDDSGELDDYLDPPDPDQPSAPEEPEEPKEPEQPEKPSEPEQPEKPSEPEQPEKPSEPEQPEQPSEPEQPEKPSEPEQPEKPSEPEQKVYTISGQVWMDLNKNGQKEETEQFKSGVKVTLIDMLKGDFATDGNGNRITTNTDTQGKYTFTNIIEGSYTLMFEFDTNTYTVSTYKKEGIGQEVNSDAILSTVTINNEKKAVALTDKIEINDNKENIDLGLIENPIFNLSLDKKITTITVIDDQGTKKYDYKDGHTAKVDLVAKYMNGANVIINYQFTITNNGEVTGYVDSLLDTLPSGLEFSSELNKDWYKGNDDNLYTTSLAGKAIKPGESIQIDLVLTKTMTEESTGTFVNSARLEKISNLENLKEKDEALEGNESSAILIISIKTGSVFLYLGITMSCIAILAVGAYIIKKKILDRGI